MMEAKDTGRGRASSIAFGALDLVSAILVYVGVFEGLPARFWLVDGAGAVVAALFAAAGAGLIGKQSWASRVAVLASMVSLLLGLLLISTLALTASYLSGIYGPVGRGGALILSLLAATALPYLVALPIAQLAWLRRRPSVPLATTPARSES
jgi:hypothetical protein